ncbi:MAG: hypothetical protein U0792_21345 [Gemmataceae bacterium]
MNRLSRTKTRRTVLGLELLEDRDVPTGTVTVGLTGGVLSLTGDDRDNIITNLKVEASQVTVTPDATTDVGAGAGNPKVFLGTATSLSAVLKGGGDGLTIDPASDFILTGAASIDLGDGGNALTMKTSGKIELGSLVVKGGEGLNAIAIQAGAGLGKVTGVASINSIGESFLVMTEMNFSGTSGLLVSSGGAATGAYGNVTVAKTMTMALAGDGGSQTFGGCTLGGLKATGALAFITLDTTTVNGSVSISSSLITSFTTANNVKLTGDLTLSGVSYGAQATLAGTFEANNVKLTSTSGDVILTATGTFKTAGSLTLVGRNTEANFNGVTDDHGNVTNTISATIGGNLTVSGKFRSKVLFGTTALSEVHGNVTMTGGFTQNLFFTNELFKVDMNVLLTLGSFKNTVSIGDITQTVPILGSLTIKGGKGDDRVTLLNVAVTGITSINLGSGSDFLDIDLGSTFTGTFLADMGTGDDVLGMAHLVDATAPVTFNGKATIKMGSGNDWMILGLGTGGTASTKVNFNGVGSLIDGGTNYNEFDDGPTMNYSGLTFGTSILNFIDPTP